MYLIVIKFVPAITLLADNAIKIQSVDAYDGHTIYV